MPKPEAAGAARFRQALAFVALVLVCALLLGLTARLTEPRIDANRTRQLTATIEALTGAAVAPGSITWENGQAPLCGPITLLRGEAAGYGGPIRWLAAARRGEPPTLTGVRIVSHQETPGIADFLDHPERGWLVGFQGLDTRGAAEVAAVSGATITSRALGRAFAAALDAPLAVAAECPP